jgi:hypothetical protein
MHERRSGVNLVRMEVTLSEMRRRVSMRRCKGVKLTGKKGEAYVGRVEVREV